jgi:hypothetical protein
MQLIAALMRRAADYNRFFGSHSSQTAVTSKEFG